MMPPKAKPAKIRANFSVDQPTLDGLAVIQRGWSLDSASATIRFLVRTELTRLKLPKPRTAKETR